MTESRTDTEELPYLIRLLDEISLQLRTLLGTEFKKAEASLDGVKLAGQTFFEEFCVKYPEKVAIMLRESVGQSPLVEEHHKKIFDKFISAAHFWNSFLANHFVIIPVGFLTIYITILY